MSFPAPLTVQTVPSPKSTPAPKRGIALAALRQSALKSGFEIFDLPSAKAERMRALIVWLFEPGTVILPPSLCGVEIMFMEMILMKKSRACKTGGKLHALRTIRFVTILFP